MRPSRFPPLVAVVAVLGLVVVSRGARAETLPDKTERLMGLARVWAEAKYFHPYLQYKPIDWDAALVAAIPKVEAATTLAEYRAAVQQMLAKIGDPVTRVMDDKPASPPAAATAKKDIVTRPQPDIVVVDMAAFIAGGFDYMGFMAKGKDVAKQAETAKVMIVDLRAPNASGTAFGVERFTDAFPAIDEWPVQRVVEHHGFRTQDGVTSGDYFSTFITLGAQPPKPAPAHGPAHVVFVADEHSAIPMAALALQASGRGTIVASGAISEANIVRDKGVSLPGGIDVDLRLGELSAGTPVADVRAPATELTTRALAVAKAAVAKPPAVKRAVAVALPPLRPYDDNDYASAPYPSRELRLLAGMRAWAVLEYFHPYRYLAGDWDRALRDTLPKLEAARDADAYVKVLREMAARSGDGHVGVRAAVFDPKLRGRPPFAVRLVEGKLAVTRLADAAASKQIGIAVGDVIETVDGVPMKDALAEARLVISGSTDEARDQSAAASMLGGATGTAIKLGVRGADGKLREVQATRDPAFAMAQFKPPEGPHWKKLANNIGFVDLNLLTRDEVPAMFKELGASKAIVFDMRGYPNGVFMLLGQWVNARGAKHAAEFLQPLVTGDGFGSDQRVRFLQQIEAAPAVTVYKGKVVVLIDDRAVSQSEHTCLFLDEAAGATFIGSPTHGANGDVTMARLPGGLRMSFTGQEVRHVDGRRLQRVGIQPNVLIRPTIAGIRAGKDELLDRALAYIATGK